MKTLKRMQKACLETHFHNINLRRNISSKSLSLGVLASQLLSSTEPDLERSASSLIIVDDVSVLACDFNNEMVRNIAGESDEVTMERGQSGREAPGLGGGRGGAQVQKKPAISTWG
ncbi:hypothetical protein PpBr36_07753 [Pyricularia pennisetigena]|uniref:hypothetical protein n=1 Tax=Pyricularia pennisetigena TaxID=1578925 RepID=UPI0011522AEA|nr:hypothetical protein PpBr36_07753 [Pyricularia pennisetigena]TLS25333.1 hypothetical protein PpBr36_07753 [Pyricularia pennisetigena]